MQTAPTLALGSYPRPPQAPRPSAEELTEEFYAGRQVGTGLFADAFSNFASIEGAREADKQWREYDAHGAQIEHDRRRRSAELRGPMEELEKYVAEIKQLSNEAVDAVRQGSPAKSG